MSDPNIRRMDIKIEIDLWKWPEGYLERRIDVTSDILNYRFQKTIKTPQGSCQLSVVPQRADTHILDVLNTMDVIRIYEFGTLKFVGYITRIGYTGAINARTGQPERSTTITCQQFGGLLAYTSIGLGLGTALGAPEGSFRLAAEELGNAILNATIGGVTFAEMITVLTSGFEDYLTNIKASKFLTYLQTYLDTSSGLATQPTPALPRTFELFTGTEQSLTFWQVAEQLVEKPFNEFWIDNGPRKVFIDNANVELPEKACFVFRPTPFNGTIVNGNKQNLFDSLPVKRVDRNHLVQFDLSKSMDEVYTFYSVKTPAYDLSQLEKLIYALVESDDTLVGKYLFRPLTTDLFYTRLESLDSNERSITEATLDTFGKERANTLKNWFANNENFLSGVITHMVPTNNDNDPKIGDKIEVEGITGFFYVEGVAHTWKYQGDLRSNLTVTRGFNRNEKIELKDRIFRRNRLQ